MAARPAVRPSARPAVRSSARPSCDHHRNHGRRERHCKRRHESWSFYPKILLKSSSISLAVNWGLVNEFYGVPNRSLLRTDIVGTISWQYQIQPGTSCYRIGPLPRYQQQARHCEFFRSSSTCAHTLYTYWGALLYCVGGFISDSQMNLHYIICEEGNGLLIKSNAGFPVTGKWQVIGRLVLTQVTFISIAYIYTSRDLYYWFTRYIHEHNLYPKDCVIIAKLDPDPHRVTKVWHYFRQDPAS